MSKGATFSVKIQVLEQWLCLGTTSLPAAVSFTGVFSHNENQTNSEEFANYR